MPDIKWTQFPSGGDLLTTDELVGLRGAVNQRFNATNLVWNGTIGNTVFVATSGSDSTGTGTLQKPFSTVAHAMSTITTATASNPFNIVVFGGLIIETAQILLKPNIGIIGLGHEVVVQQTTTMILDATYLNASSSSTAITGLTIGSINFDFSTATVPSGHVINIDSASVGSVTINANNNVLPTLSIQNVGMGNLTVNNCILLLYGTTLGAFTGGNLASTRQLSTIVVGNSFSGAIDLQAQIAGFECFYFFRGNYLQSTVTLTNPQCNWDVDVSTYKTPTIVNNAVVILNSISDGLRGNYSPVNYSVPGTAIDASVKEHLAGIDDALGGSTALTTNVVYVSKSTGSDTPGVGNGSYGRPYLTIEYALSQITTASGSNVFKILLFTDNYVENNLTLKPWIFIDGNDSTLRVTGAITADSSFSSGGNILIENFSQVIAFTGSGMVFDVSTASFNGVIVILKNITDALINPMTFTGSGSSTNVHFIDYQSNGSTTLNNCAFNFLNYQGFNITGNYTTLSDFYSCSVNNTSLNGTLSITGDGTPTTSLSILNSPLINAVSATGTNMNIGMASDSVTTSAIPTLSGGATVAYDNVSNGIQANIVPSNYTPTNGQVSGHLTGIDNRLGSLNIGILTASGRIDSLDLFGFNAGSEVTTTSQAVTTGVDYIANSGSLITFSLPAAAVQFSKVRVVYKGAGGFRLTANTGQTIVVGASTSSSGGTVTSSSVGASITLECTTANTVWTTICREGTFTVA